MLKTDMFAISFRGVLLPFKKKQHANQGQPGNFNMEKSIIYIGWYFEGKCLIFDGNFWVSLYRQNLIRSPGLKVEHFSCVASKSP